MYTDDPYPAPYYPAKPHADDLAELPPPITATTPGYHAHPIPSRHPILDALAGPVWLAAGMLVAVLAMTSPGCVGAGGPVVSAKADVSVKEVGHLASLGNGPRSGNGELNANVTITLAWPSKGAHQ